MKSLRISCQLFLYYTNIMQNGLVFVIANFYSHAPRGARHFSDTPYSRHIEFLLTRPSRGATCKRILQFEKMEISTHTPLAGRDTVGAVSHEKPGEFLLTRPSRGATIAIGGAGVYVKNFYSHAPRGARQNAGL